MQIRFDGRTAIVTGAAHGLGRAIALNLAKLGARVVACDVLRDELDETARLSKGQATEIVTRVVDVSDRYAVQAAMTEILKDHGRIDILVNDAGGVMGQVGRPLENISEEDWRAIFAVNLDGAFYCCQAVTPAMKAARYGRIVNISSGAGLRVSLTGIQAYAFCESGPNRINAATCARTRAMGNHGEQRGTGIRPLQPGHGKTMGSIWGRRPAATRREHRVKAPRLASGYCEWSSVSCQRARRLDNRPDALDRRRTIDSYLKQDIPLVPPRSQRRQHSQQHRELLADCAPPDGAQNPIRGRRIANIDRKLSQSRERRTFHCVPKMLCCMYGCQGRVAIIVDGGC
ncbi:MAG TPA: SDR family NAD(P)-dependent oxidoreductase [Candidatus Acidoferrales bacterium]|nr:SDR family NAD(P)-dependent oxidoreductase [Candidatus Acidoferrales bacterium]